jgi:hypothetical protein
MNEPKKVETMLALNACADVYMHAASLPGAFFRSTLCAEFVIKVLGRAPARLRVTVSEEPMEGSFAISKGRMYEAPSDYRVNVHRRSQATFAASRRLLENAFPEWRKLHVLLQDADEGKDGGK